MFWNTLKKGNIGEKLAERHLKKNNYKIVKRNFRCKLGEIDIIARDNDTLVFVEVKTRKNECFMPAEYAVDKKKQRHIKMVAEYFINKNSIKNTPCRFDVITVCFNNSNVRFNLIKNAFEIF